MDIEILPVRHASPVSAISTAAGPERLLRAGLEDRLASSGHDVRIREVCGPEGSGSSPIGREFAVAAGISDQVRAARRRGRMPMVLSGSCHAAVGSVAGLERDRRGVLWLDAHADFNTPETTESGLLDGMVLATITGRCWAGLRSGIPGFEPVADRDVLMLGIRDLDRGESSLLDESAITVLSAEETASELERELERLAEHVSDVYVHLDLDVLDASEGKANAWATSGGLTRDELGRALATIQRRCGIGVLTLASYEPDADPEGRACDAAIDAVEAGLADR